MARLDAPLEAEVVFIQAPAAVGKSTVAARLSAAANAPLLDLGSVPVSTGTLKFVISELDLEGDDAVAAFHGGKLPIVVDALDEGRIRSGETGFESFVETVGELLMEDRRAATSPKVIFLGRPESISLARQLLALHAAKVGWTSFEVGYFDETAARRMVDVYARHSPRLTAEYQSHPEPVDRVITAYFNAIAQALNLRPEDLWKSDRGREFAGYAPVLAAVGTLLAETTNFVSLENALVGLHGATEAWSVIAQVVQETTVRERQKLCDKLPDSISGIPEAYDQIEQLTFLADCVSGRPLRRSKRLALSGDDAAKYYDAVQQYIHDHPFLRSGDFANHVLAAPVLAHGIVEDLWREADDDRLSQAARHPFLWRALSGRISEDSLIDGRYLGFALCSLWNDPSERRARVMIRGGGAGEATRVQVSLSDRRIVAFDVVPPLFLHAILGDCDVEVEDRLVLTGQPGASAAALLVEGEAVLITTELDVRATTIAVAGSLWLAAETVTADRRLEIRVRDGAQVGWGGALEGSYPWDRHPATLAGPPPPPGSYFEHLLSECAVRLASGATITLSPDYRVIEDDRLRWAERMFRDAFPELIRLMVKHKLATTDTMSAGGTAKVRIRFETRFADLLRDLRAGSGSKNVASFLREASDRISA